MTPPPREYAPPESAAPHLLLVGGGHAMLPALMRARQWTRGGARVSLVNDHRHLYYSGMVPEFLGGVYTVDEVRIDLRRLCRTSGARFVLGRAAALNPAARTLTLADGRALRYDLAAFDIGARNPGGAAADDANGHGTVIRTKPLFRVRQLEECVQAVLRGERDFLTLAVVGGGAAGTEVALNLTARFRARGRAGALRLHLVERASRLLADFPSGLSAYAADQLIERGAALHLGRRVTQLKETCLVLDRGERLAADAVLWATGSAGQPLFAEAGLPIDERGFLRVHPTLQCTSAPALFAAGDCAVIEGHEDLARVGVHAVKQGPVLAANLEQALAALRTDRPLRHDEMERFDPYPVAPLILSTGTPEALWTAGPVWLRGTPFLRLKHFVDQRWMRRYHGGRWQRTPLWKMLDARAAADGQRRLIPSPVQP